MLWVGLGGALSVAVCVLAVRTLDVARVLSAIARVGLVPIATAIVLRLALLVAQAARWRVLLPEQGRPRFTNLLAYHLVASAANWAAPFRAGEVVRIGMLARNEAVAWPTATAAQAVEKVHEGIGLLVLALPLATGSLGTQIPWVRTAAMALTGFVVFSVMIVVAVSRYRAGAPPARVRRLLDKLRYGASSLRDVRRSTAAIAWTLFGYSAEGGMVLVVARSTGIHPSFAVAALTLLAINAALLLPAAPGQLGTFEAAVTVSLAATGAPRDVTFALALVLHGCHAVADLGAAALAAPAIRRRTRAI